MSDVEKYFAIQSSKGRENLALRSVDTVNEEDARGHLQSLSIKKIDVDSFVNEARLLGYEFSIFPEIMGPNGKDEDIRSRLEVVSRHLRALNKGIFVGPEQEQDVKGITQTYEVQIKGKLDDNDRRAIIYGFAVPQWRSRLVQLAQRKVEEITLDEQFG